MSVATNFAKLLANIGNQRDEQIEILKEASREKALQLLEQLFGDLFADNQKLTHIFCMGYTPEWNDGEECFHDTNILIHNDRDGWGEMEEFLECHLKWEIDPNEPSEEFLAINAGLNASQCRDIEDLIPIDAMSEALGTNWVVIATRNGVELQEYNCGY